MAKKRTAADWAKLVGGWRRSGLDGPQYAASTGLPIEQLRWWKWRLGKIAAATTGARSTAMVRVEVRPPTADSPLKLASASAIEISRGAWTVRVASDFDSHTLAQVLDVVAARSC